MKQVSIITLISVIATAAAPVATSAATNGVTISTAKSVAQFGGCFVDAQDRAAQAWAYVPKADGGTFSNAGSKGATSVYFLAVSDRGRIRELRLESASAASLDAHIAKAVSQCA
jgi:hypothetical protein